MSKLAIVLVAMFQYNQNFSGFLAREKNRSSSSLSTSSIGEFRQGFHFQCLAISEMLLEGTCMSVFCFVSCICIVIHRNLSFFQEN